MNDNYENKPRIMKRIIKQLYIAGVVSLLGLTSCNDWLDVQSKVDIKEDEIFSSESGYWDALVGVYTGMTGNNLYGSALSMSTMEMLACNYDIQSDYFDPGTFNLSLYNYTSTLSRPMIDGIWNSMYAMIANDNNLLRFLDKADRSIFDGDNYNLIRGEALALRAYMHFDLLRIFGESFNMNPNAKAIPYVTVFSKDQTPRSTVNEVVELALKDLREAEKCLENDPILDSSFETENIYLLYRQNRMNYLAVRALMARIYMYRGTEADRKQALEIAVNLIKGQSIIRFLTSSQMASNRLLSPEIFFNLYKDDITKVYNSYYLPKFGSTGSLDRSGRLVQSKKLIEEMFDAAKWGVEKDGRLRYQFSLNAGYYFLTKYEQRDGDAYAAKCRIPMLRLTEMYYIAAECTEDVAAATQFLKDVWRTRGYGLPDLGIKTREDLLNFVANEYRREFYGEGQLFYYYKRNHYTSIPNCKVNISDRLKEVYVLPIPEDEQNYSN